ncbi:MAG: 4-hydroxyphenylpyruvate dioxygenase [Phycisphaerae bacterium]
MATTAAPNSAPAATADFLPIENWDHIEFYVGNARQAAHFYRLVFGFDVVAYRGLETGCRDRASYVLKQGNITFVLTTALGPDCAVARHVALHGDGVKVIALKVRDVDAALAETKRRGATVLQPATTLRDDSGELRIGTIKVYGDTVHTFVQRGDYRGAFMPGYAPASWPKAPAVGLAAIDHMVGNVELGAMNHWVSFYRDVMGFSQLAHFSDQDISTEYSALMSKVMENGNGRVKFPINEPAEGRRKSQIEEYLDYYHGPGVQHIAMNTKDICATVRALRSHGVQFLRVPDAYYDALLSRVGKINEDVSELRELGVLVDRDDEGYLLQIFTQPVQDRPTLFFEIIERHGSRGFGVGNFKALFISIEEEQRRRGNL